MCAFSSFGTHKHDKALLICGRQSYKLTPESQSDNRDIDFMATTHCFYICAYLFEPVTQ